MRTVAIAGVGLIGGSFALAIRRAGFRGEILGVSSAATIEQAMALGVIDEGVPIEEACGRADLIYLAQPIRQILDLLPRLNGLLRPETLVTDAGSTKALIVETARRTLRSGLFLGGHPMAGKEVRGVAAADAALFDGRPYVLTPTPPEMLKVQRVAEFVELVRAIGATPVILGADEHDLAVAYTSHLPQLVSTALAATLENVKEPAAISGPGVLDSTRLALSPFDVWRDIFVTNDVHIQQALDEFVQKLLIIKTSLPSGETGAMFAAAAEVAKRLRNK